MNMYGDDAFIRAKTRLTEAKADIAELEALKRKGELIERSQVLKLWNEKANIVKNKLLGLPELALQRGSIAAIKKELKTRIYEILTELSQEDGSI